MRELLTKKALKTNSYQVVLMLGEDYELYKLLFSYYFFLNKRIKKINFI
jgi:hypothetical protein